MGALEPFSSCGTGVLSRKTNTGYCRTMCSLRECQQTGCLTLHRSWMVLFSTTLFSMITFGEFLMLLPCTFQSDRQTQETDKQEVTVASSSSACGGPMEAVLLGLFVLSCPWAFLHSVFCLTFAHVDLAFCLRFPVFLFTLMASWTSSALSGTPVALPAPDGFCNLACQAGSPAGPTQFPLQEKISRFQYIEQAKGRHQETPRTV